MGEVAADDVQGERADGVFGGGEFDAEGVGEDIGVVEQPRGHIVGLVSPHLSWVDPAQSAEVHLSSFASVAGVRHCAEVASVDSGEGRAAVASVGIATAERRCGCAGLRSLRERSARSSSATGGGLGARAPLSAHPGGPAPMTKPFVDTLPTTPPQTSTRFARSGDRGTARRAGSRPRLSLLE